MSATRTFRIGRGASRTAFPRGVV
ncbi:DUF1534 domain-containing protein [Pseudomonas syringae]|uniref:DUF1534 domain-containing protein n=1 Tax=Pseudomonas syringae TaxID=317 RepID=A0A6B2B3N3_PSESX|nr:DUF1534 domain-containing protein [Pseudomonas syringae]NAO45623.1 DUF1534 domain-containing protein [Pseudomonas syringae]NAO50661.1 DUF1534 domain-containing protein [Pseudomonas syringae]NAO64212.1 DUF1534 domain-containing protein [Pseudomonas syringae]NAO69275.1 DUF1534 domain-containing protein [Pseudomonas syringae]